MAESIADTVRAASRGASGAGQRQRTEGHADKPHDHGDEAPGYSVAGAEATVGSGDDQPAATVSGLTPKRAVAVAAVVVGLTGAVIGGLALARSAGRIGTGTGRRVAIVALVVGLIAMVLGKLALARSGRTGRPDSPRGL